MSKKPQPSTPAKEIRSITGRVTRIHLFEYTRADGEDCQGSDVTVAVGGGATTEFYKLTLLGEDALGIITGEDWDFKQSAFVKARPALAKGQMVEATGQYTLERWDSEKHGIVMVPTLKILSHHDVKIALMAKRPRIVLPETAAPRQPKVRAT